MIQENKTKIFAQGQEKWCLKGISVISNTNSSQAEGTRIKCVNLFKRFSFEKNPSGALNFFLLYLLLRAHCLPWPGTQKLLPPWSQVSFCSSWQQTSGSANRRCARRCWVMEASTQTSKDGQGIQATYKRSESLRESPYEEFAWSYENGINNMMVILGSRRCQERGTSQENLRP